MRRNKNEEILKEYVRSILMEDDGHHVEYSGDNGGPYGVSFGSGQDLFDTFVGPFVDVFKTAAGKSKEFAEKTKTLLFVAYKTVLTTLIPIYGYNYADVFDKEKQKIEKIRNEYKDVYDRTDKALKMGDAAMLAFMASPALSMGALAATKGPGVAKEALSILSGGMSDTLFDKVKNKAIGAGRWALGDDEGSRRKTESYVIGETQKSMLTPEKIFKNKEFISRSLENPRIKEIQKVATETFKASLNEIYTQAENVLKNAKSVDDLEKFAKKKIPEADKIKTLQGEDRVKAEKMLLIGVKKAMKEFYIKNLTDQVNSVIRAGIPEEAQYVKDFRETIKKIQSL